MTGTAEVHRQAEKVARDLQAVLGEDLVGVYLHGSLALGCFNLGLSDLDLLAVARRKLSLDEKRELLEVLAAKSMQPAKIDFHLVTEAALDPWRHPLPLDFHYSETWREELLANLAEGLNRQRAADPDLAAHVTVVRERGEALIGPPPRQVFPEIPTADYADALMDDLRWSRESDRASPLYRTLSPARIWATLATGEVHSKASGADWALERLPVELRPILVGALARYREEQTNFDPRHQDLRRYADYVEAEARSIASRYARS